MLSGGRSLLVGTIDERSRCGVMYSTVGLDSAVMPQLERQMESRSKLALFYGGVFPGGKHGVVSRPCDGSHAAKQSLRPLGRIPLGATESLSSRPGSHGGLIRATVGFSRASGVRVAMAELVAKVGKVDGWGM